MTLHERIVAATGPTWELKAAIARALGYRLTDRKKLIWKTPDGFTVLDDDLPDWPASTDAALGLARDRIELIQLLLAAAATYSQGTLGDAQTYDLSEGARAICAAAAKQRGW